MYTYTRTYVHTHIHTFIHTNINTYIHTYTHTHINIYIRTYIYTYIHIYIHTYLQAYIHGVTLQKTAVLKSHITQFRLQPSPPTSVSHFNITAPSISMGPAGFPTNILHIFRISSMRATYSAQLILPDFIIQRNSFRSLQRTV